MTDHPVDLRSDTVTQPTPAMRDAMAHAEVGDDVFGDDPTVNRLQERLAELLGKEAALFVPSGTMANQIALRTLTQPGDEIIAHEDSHVYHYEGGGPAALSGCSFRLLRGAHGRFPSVDLHAAIRPADSHYPRTAVVVVENTHNRGGGAIWPVDAVAELHHVASEAGLRMHLDGARLMNACVATGLEPVEYARYFDTVSMCFSKGLGAPIGSVVAGSRELMNRAHRLRKMFGGGMRQVGIIAAGALYAIEHHVERLAEDHRRAHALAAALAEMPSVRIDVPAVQTNIVIFEIDPAWGTAAQLAQRLEAQGIRMLAIAPQRVRAVTHLHITDADIDRARTALADALHAAAPR